jgi:hypothetical protein
LPAKKPPIKDQPRANAGAHHHDQDVLVALACPESPLGQRGGIGVVFNHDWHIQAILQQGTKGQPTPGRPVGPLGDRPISIHQCSQRHTRSTYRLSLIHLAQEVQGQVSYKAHFIGR